MKIVPPVSDSTAKNNTLAIRNSRTGPRYGLRRPSRYATVRTPGRLTRYRKLRTNRLSMLVNASKICPNRPRKVSSRACSGLSPQVGQKGDATRALQLGQVHCATLAIAAPHDSSDSR